MRNLKETGDQEKPAGQAAGPKKPRAANRPSELIAVELMIEGFKKEVEQKAPKLSVGDFIRLVQLRDVLEEEVPREIRVTWVEPAEQQHASKT